MAVESIGEEVVEHLRVVRAPEPDAEPAYMAPPPRRAPRTPEMEQVMMALANVLTVRLMLFASVVFGGIMAALCMPAPETKAIILLAVWAFLVIGPLIWLAQRRT